MGIEGGVDDELSGFSRLEKSTPDEVRCIDKTKNLENRREGRGREKWLNSESVTQTKRRGGEGAT